MKLKRNKTRGFCRGKSLLAWVGQGQLLAAEEIVLHQFLQQLVSIQLADHAAGIVVVGDIGGIFRKQITDDLINGIVTFFLQGVEHRAQDPAHAIPVVAGDCEFLCALVRHDFDLLMVIVVLYPKKGKV